MAQMTLSGSLIRGYRLHEMIGQGMYAIIYRATRQNLETDVAIKVINTETALEPVFIKRFEREARLISRLKHPHITPLHDYWRDEYGAYIVMEFYAGGSLRQQLREAPFTIEETLRTLEACADALDYMHRNDVLHRDIKPDNIFFDKQGNAYLGDLGIAKDLDDLEGLTGAGDVLGTPHYSSPEQMKGDTLSPQSDIFSLGITLYESLARAHPFPNISPAIAALRMLSEPLPHLDSVSDEINAVLQKATAKNASERYGTALEMALAFREAVAGKSTAPTISDLTPRELEVLQHLADGLNNNEIAEAMFIERQTVRWYLRQIYPKLGAESRGQAIVIAHQHDLIFRELEHEEEEEKQVTAELLKTNLKRHNLPAETGEFVGRKDDLDQIREVLEDPKTRLLTILAPGGMGKTSFAIETARQQFDNFRDGVYLIELAHLKDVQQIPSTIAEALGFQFQQKGDSLAQLLNYLEHKNLLLVMDSFEHLLEGSPIISQILAKSQEVKIIVTSRERLNLRSEMVFSIFGLAYPGTIKELEEYESAALFIQEMRRSQPDFELNEETAPHILRICRLVEGMPLALILASAWGEMLSVEEIANEIQKSLDFLAVDMPDMPQRHWDMRVVLRSTWERLSQSEQDAFMKMSVFRGGCSRQAAETVTGANLRTLMSLVSKSLLRRDTETGRFTVHELLRQYAEEQLEQSGEALAVRNTFTNYYAKAMQECEAQLKDHRQIEALDDIEGDFENVRAAWLWAIEKADGNALNAICESLDIFSEARNRLEEAQALFEASHQLEGRISKAVWGRLLTRHRSSDIQKRREWLETALEIAREQGEAIELACTLRHLASILPALREVDSALNLAEESLALSKTTDDLWGQASTKHLIAFIHQARLDLPEEGYRFEREAYEIFYQLGHPVGLAITLNNMGLFELYHGDVELAQTYLQDALSWWGKIGQAHTWTDTLSNLSRIATYHAHFDKADEYIAEAYQIAVESGSRAAILMALASRCNLLVMQEAFQDALEITYEMVALRQLDDNPNQFWYVDTNQGIALCGLERYEEASIRIDKALIHGFRLGQPQWIARILLGKSIILAYQGQPERALELFALNVTLPEVKFWYNKHPLAVRLQQQLHAHFDESDYQAIWERGQAQADNWREVVKSLLAEIEIAGD